MANDFIQFAVGTTSPQEVIGKLKATQSTDPDVLFAAKTEFSAPFRQQRGTGLLLLIVGAVSSLTVVLAIIGIPVALFGAWVWRRGVSNLAIVETAYAQFTGPASAIR
jgi:hypothetical protein